MKRHDASAATEPQETEPQETELRDGEAPESFVGMRVSHIAPTTAVSAPRRNGHASVLARVVDLISGVRNHGSNALTLSLSPEDEAALRDADLRQLDASALGVAASGTRDEWRALLADRFRTRYGLLLRFDVQSTRVDA